MSRGMRPTPIDTAREARPRASAAWARTARRALGEAAHALCAFLSGFTGLASGRPDAGGDAPDTASVRRALEEHAARRRSCC